VPTDRASRTDRWGRERPALPVAGDTDPGAESLPDVSDAVDGSWRMRSDRRVRRLGLGIRDNFARDRSDPRPIRGFLRRECAPSTPASGPAGSPTSRRPRTPGGASRAIPRSRPTGAIERLTALVRAPGTMPSHERVRPSRGVRRAMTTDRVTAICGATVVVECRHCGLTVSPDIDSCPACGANTSAATRFLNRESCRNYRQLRRCIRRISSDR